MSADDISNTINRLKRKINKKQLDFASLTQKLNGIKEKYIEKDITYNTTLEEIDTIRDRYNASSRELAELARSLSALGKQKIKLKQRLQHPTKDLTKVSEQIFMEEIDNVLSDMDSEAQDIIIKRHHALLDKNTEINVDKLEFRSITMKITVQNTVAIEKGTVFGHLHINNINRTKDFYITEGYTYGELADDARRYWGEVNEMEDGSVRRYAIADEGGSFFIRDAEILPDIQSMENLEYKRFFLFEIEHIPLYELQAFAVDFKEIHWTELEKQLDAIMAQRQAVVDAQKELFTPDEVLNDRKAITNDLFIFVLFTVIYFFALTTRRSALKQYGQSWRMKYDLQVQTGFDDIKNFQDWWNWTYRIGDVVNNKGRLPGTIGSYGYVLGGIRIRQLRVEKDCRASLQPLVKDQNVRNDPDAKLEFLYGPYDRRFCYSVEHYGPLKNMGNADSKWTRKIVNVIKPEDDSANFPTGISDTLFRIYDAFHYKADPSFYPSTLLKSYKDKSFFDTANFNGENEVYGGGGFAAELPRANMTKYMKVLGQLKEYNWVDQQTRALLMTFNVYNPNSNVYSRILLLVEKDESGLAHPLGRYRSFYLDYYTSTAEKFHLIFDIILMTCMVYFLNVQRQYYDLTHYKVMVKPTGPLTFYKYKRCGVCRVWFFNFKTVQDISIYAMYIAAQAVRIRLYNSSKRNFDFSLDFYREMATEEYYYQTAFVLDGICFLMLAVKFFRYVKLDPRLNVIVVMFMSGFWILVGYVTVFMTMMFAFAIFSNHIFGKQLREYSEPLLALRTCFFILFGKIDYMAVKEVDDVMAPIFFLSFEIIMYFIMANMFVAILNHLYRTTLLIHEKYNKEHHSEKQGTRLSNFQLWKNILFPGWGDSSFMKMVFSDRA